MKVMQTITFEDRTRVRVQRRDGSDYHTYGAVDYVTKEWDRDRTMYYVLHHNNGETSTFNTKDWQILREAFVEFM